MIRRLKALARPKPRLGLGANAATAQQAEIALAQALERQRERLRKHGDDAVALQLVGQVTPAAEWPKLLAHWDARNPSGVAAWPRRLDPGAYALNLWPMRAGSARRLAGVGGDVRKRQPKQLLTTPGLTVFSPEETAGDAQTALAVVCATWLDDVGTSAYAAMRLAPPM
jgi:hypothetical protein